MPTFRELRARVTERDNKIHEQRKAGKLNNPHARPLTVSEIERKLHDLELALADREAEISELSSRPQYLLIPTTQGMVSSNAYQMNQRKEDIMPSIMAELRAFQDQLRRETYEDVTNFDDYDFSCSLNGAKYVVPARSTKRLPATLAQHFRMKKSYEERNERLTRETGGRGSGEETHFVGFAEFKQAINTFDSADVDSGERQYVF